MLTDKELEEIRRKMLELEEEPPVGEWQRIQPEIQPKKYWRPIWWLLPLLLLLLTGLGTYHALRIDNKENIPTGTQAMAEKPATSENLPAEKIQKQEPVADLPPVTRAQDAAQPAVDDAPVAINQPKQQELQPLPEPTAPEANYTSGAVFPEKRNRPEIPVIALLPGRPTVIRHLPGSVEREPRSYMYVRPVPLRGSLMPGTKTQDEFSKEKSINTVELTPAFADKKVAEADEADKKTPETILADSTVQEVEKKKKPAPQEKVVHSRNEWTAGLYFAPRYAFRKFVPNTTDDILITGIRNANQLDPERMGYEFGANYSRVLVPGLFLEGGLSWMQLKENVTYTLTQGLIDTVTVRQAINGQVVVASKFITEERQLVSSYAYGGLRIGATYYFLETNARRLNVTLAGGANLLIKGTTRQFSNGTWTETLEFPSVENILEQSNYNLQVGVGYNVSVLENYEISLMPTVNYFLGSTFKEREPLGLKPYSLGLNLQLKRRFNR